MNNNILNIADSFYSVGIEISHNINNNKKYAYGILLALSCELYLKSILKDSKFPNERVHDLLILCNALAEVDKETIKSKFYLKTSVELFDVLEKCKDIFVQWRYPFENNNDINLDEFIDLVETIKEYAHEIIINN